MPIWNNVLRMIAIACAGLFAILADVAPAMAAREASTSTSCLPGSLKSTLAKIRDKFGPIDILSTHRPGARIAGSGKPSFHASCRAVDFKPRRNHGAVIAWLKANHGGGVGTYSGRMNHIHIDNGPYVRFHHGGSRYAAKSRTGYRFAAKSSRTRRS